MSKFADTIAELSPVQRALFEAQLQKKRRAVMSRESACPATYPAAPQADRDEENLVLAEARGSAEELLGEFYGRFPWPWQPMTFSYLDDPRFEIIMLNQDLGDWEHKLIDQDCKVWVAGCGTNQALLTALRFPKASVLGTDVSVKSLEVCASNARQIGVSNLELKEESINDAIYRDEFDYIICTGVIHHNVDPQATLARLASALKPAGVMELMVYNRFHRSLTSAFQKAIRILGESRGTVDFESDLAMARKIADHFPVENQLGRFLKRHLDSPESEFADLLIQPVEHSYTVESLECLAGSCGLELVLPCTTLYAKYKSPTITWNLQFGDPELQQAYESLPDSRRWQATNLLLQEKSSLLWFYLQRTDCGRPRKSEKQVCEEFLDRSFVRSNATQRSYIRQSDGTYELSPHLLSYPSAQPDVSVREILEAVESTGTMREAFRRARVEPLFPVVNQARIYLTTSAFPHLKAVSGETR
ncbi:MAG TPA: class I SAM-dependent methyltransferase [Blastocatellia bacterium]|nr:class I SAM-dependent methyltransferase [Blastocatellia bacterium]